MSQACDAIALDVKYERGYFEPGRQLCFLLRCVHLFCSACICVTTAIFANQVSPFLSLFFVAHRAAPQAVALAIWC
jgi:hypothetical protein